MKREACIALLIVAVPMMVAGSALAQNWNPFDPFAQSREKSPRDERRQQKERSDPAPAPGGREAIWRDPLEGLPLDEKGRAVERGDLAPVMATDGSGLPFELWRGLDVATVETLIGDLEIPPRSPAIHALWRRLITSDVTPPSGGVADSHFMALRLEALYRSGLIKEFSDELAKAASAAADPLIATLSAKADIGRGAIDKGCDTAKSLGSLRAQMPKRLKAEAILITGYCAARAGNAAAAGLAAELAREEGTETSPGLEALDALAAGTKPKMRPQKRISLIDYRLIELGGAIDPASVLGQAEPSLLAAFALDTGADIRLRLAAGEAAARVNAVAPQNLTDIYLAQTGSDSADALLGARGAAGADAARRRALLFKAAAAERTPLRKVRLVRAFLDDARRAGLYLFALQMIADASDGIATAPEVGWYAETGIEVALAAGRYDRVRQWASFGSGVDHQAAGGLDYWLALADIADGTQRQDRASNLAAVERMVAQGRFSAELLHRLATVLDALDVDVPIPLWEAASRTPQPASGHLPATGVLSELLDASKKRDFGRTVLLAMKTLGPNGSEGAHMIALGDSIRALKRAGLEGDARRLAFEALFTSWPRSVSN